MQPSNEIQDVISGWFSSIVDADMTWRDRHVSHHANLRIIGTDPMEWLEGEPAYVFLRNEAEAIGGMVKIKLLELEGFSEGSVGWGCAVPEITLPDGGKVAPRWSAVFHREDGTWKLVHLHASIAISNEAAFGDTFAAA